MSAYSNAVLALAPVAYWRLGETSGTAAIDEAGSHHGVYTGTCTLGADSLLASDTDNKSLSLSGAGYVGAGAQTDLNTSAFTILGWVNLANVSARQYIFSNYRTPEVPPYNGVIFSTLVGGKIELFTSSSYSSDTANRSRSTASLSAGTTCFLAATFTSGGAASLYINGALDSAHTGKQVPTYANCQVNLGAYSNGTAKLSGRIDDLAFFNRALTASEITNLYAMALAPYSVSGTIIDRFGNPCQRKVYAISRPTDATAPIIIAHDLSDPTTGAYELVFSTTDEVTRIVVSEDNDPLLNDLIDRVIPA